jgi:predicted nucleic acid-binding protein
MTVADTAALIAFLDKGHPQNDKAAAILSEGFITMTGGTLGEIATVTRRLAKDNGLNGNRAARDALAALMGLEGFREAAPISLVTVANMHRQEPSLSFVDAWNLCVAIHASDTLLAFDRGLRAAARRHHCALSV